MDTDGGITPAGDFSFDLRILYDKHSGRFFATAVDNHGNPNNLLFVVSKTSDPNDGWRGFKIDSDTDNEQWADFPMLGINGERSKLFILFAQD